MRLLWVLTALCSIATGAVVVPHKPVGTHPPLPSGSPQPPPAYMKDNVNNYWKSAPDKGTMDGPVLGSSNGSRVQGPNAAADNSDSYWLSSLGSAGSMPFADAGYQFYRNVKDFGAVGDGVTDDTAAINRAAASFSASDMGTLRCGKDCGSTTVLGAVVYFPPGTYLISSPIIQYYYTQFVGNPTSRPIIKGSHDFVGIALFDSDVYIPGGNSAEWYINQSNFYRQIRNFVFDMTGQNWTNYDNDQEYVPSGIHWQVGQATSITNCDFQMSVSADGITATAVGIYMENGSGGFVSDLTFFGGNIGFLAGSQQFTANNLQFTSCLTAIFQQWNWGFTWKNLYVLSCYIAIDCTSYSGITSQGTGSISVLDSHFNGVPYAITVASLGDEQPNIVLDNLLVENSASVVLISGGATIVEGSSGPLYFNSWANGYQYLPDGTGGKKQGFINPAPNKPSSLLDGSGSYFTRSKPQYEDVSSGSIVVATSHGVSNDGTGDQTTAINSLLSGNVGSLIFFPAGVYLVKGTVKIPVGSTIIGSGWSQIMATGSYFQDEENPKVVVQVGNEGDVGVIEISDMGPTAGAILMEWNVHEGSQGSAAMWDSHFRVGGAIGSDLQLADCPTGASSVNEKCKAASMLLHLTSASSGYFENLWAWVADHDLDNPANADAGESPEGVPVNVVTDISIYAGRGILIESQGPNWFYGSASEHAQMYQYQLYNASNTFLGHMQTETPYYQPNPVATSPYKAGMFSSDPTFDNCADDYCKGAWALRVIESSDIYIYSAGFYSFFQNNQLGCTDQEECQLALIDTNYAHDLWIYNIFTKGNVQIISPQGGLPPLLFNSTTKDGYTSEIAAWLALSTTGENIGSGTGNGSDSGTVTIDPVIWSEPTDSVTIQCYPPCTYVLPPLTLPTLTTFSFPPWSGPIEIGWTTVQTFTYLGTVTTTTGYVSVITTTTISIPAVTTSIIPVSNVNVTSNSTIIYPVPSIVPTPFIITDPATVNGTKLPPNTTPRTFTPPPWPGNMIPDSSSTPISTTPTSTTSKTTTTTGSGQTTSHDTHFPHITHTGGPPKPTCTRAGGCGSSCHIFCGPSCFLFCPDNHNGNWYDSNDPNKPKGPSNPGGPDDPDEECSTATYSSCRTNCVTAASTSSCTSTCNDVVGCDTTGTEISSIYTLAPYWEPYFESWDDITDSAGAGTYAWNIITSLSSHPISTMPPSTTTTPTKTPTTTTTTPKSTTTTTTTTTSSTSTFEIAIYASPSCAGDYYVVEGPALAELDPNLDCITLPNNLPQNILDDTRDNCRYFTNGGLDYGSCSGGTFDDPKAWTISSGRCQVFEGSGCNHLNAFDYYFMEGCHTYGDYDYEDIEVWGSFWCFSTGDSEPSNGLFQPANVSASLDLEYPSTMTLDTGEALCWIDYQRVAPDGSRTLPTPRYQAIAQSDAQYVVASFCEASYTLKAESKSGFAQEYYPSKDSKYGVIAQVKWADNQTGCGQQQDIELFQPGCLHAFDTAYFGCAGEGGKPGNETYGGSYIYNTTTHGCLLISLFSPTTSASPIQGPLRGRYNTTVSAIASNASIVTASSNSSVTGKYSPWTFRKPEDARLPGLWNKTHSEA